MQSTPKGMFDTVKRQLRRLASGLRGMAHEKQAAALDDYLFEHLMLYHGLVGTTPENQRKFKDVRVDIFDALKHHSSTELGIALKIAPLWWQDKLDKIFLEARQHYADSLTVCLLPDTEKSVPAPESVPLMHPDWRVRANAAIILAGLGFHDAVPAMANALHSSAEDAKAAFCHIAGALGRLRGKESYEALCAHLFSDEPWFRVDAAAALSKWPLEESSEHLMPAALALHRLNDYMAVVITQNYSPTQLLIQSGATAQEGAVEILLGLLTASQTTFASDTTIATHLPNCLPQSIELARATFSPRRTLLVCTLSDFILAQPSSPLHAEARNALNEFQNDQHKQSLLEWLKANHEQSDLTNLQHAIELVGRFQLQQSSTFLENLIVHRSPVINAAIEALAGFNQLTTVPLLTRLINDTVNLDDRTSKPPSKQPVFEDDPEAATTYWYALKGLGLLPYEDSARCLLKAVNDFAPDKRQQALHSLVSLCDQAEIKNQFKQEIIDQLKQSLSDPASTVRVAALRGVAVMPDKVFLPDLVTLANAAEAAVCRQAISSLRELAASGYEADVRTALESGIEQQRDPFKRDRLKTLLHSLSGKP